MSVLLASSAASFASSPAGYISGVVVPVAVAYAIYRLERSDRASRERATSAEKRFVRIEEAQTEQTRALAVQSEALKVMVAEFNPIKVKVGGLDDAVITLRENVTGLRAVLGMHLRVSGQNDVIPGERS